MGAFGMSYDPNANAANGAAPPSTISQTVPGYSPVQYAPPVSAVNWNPVATPAATPGGYLTDQYHAAQYPWDNPIAGMFGSGSPFNLAGAKGAGDQYQMPGYNGGVPGGAHGTPSYNYPGQTWGPGPAGPLNNSGAPAYQNQFGNNPGVQAGDQPGQGAYNNPQSLQQLYYGMQSLTPGQLQGMGGQYGAYSGGLAPWQQGFQGAAQLYANNYANPAYAAANPMSQQQTSDWLQASYNTLTGKLNANGLIA